MNLAIPKNGWLYQFVDFKPYTTVFLVAQFFDFVSTFVGIQLGHIELNPFAYLWGWNRLLLTKFLIVLFVAGFFQLRGLKKPWMNWTIVAVAALPPLWNIFNLLVSGR